MALFKGSAIVGAVSGKSGGTVFSRNKGGAYLKGYVMPINPNTAKQQAVRTSFANLVSSWKNLTPAQQQLWTDMAPQYPYQNRVGDQSVYTGEILYIKLNQNLDVVGASTLSAPLVPQTFSAVKASTLTMDLTAGVLTEGTFGLDAVPAANEAVVVTITTSMSGGITKPAKSAFKQVIVIPGASAIDDIDITAAYIALYGSPELGTKIFARAEMVNENTGQRLMLGQVETIVSGT